jgi:hypothetical protein
MDDPFERAAIRAEMDRQRRQAERGARGSRAGLRIHATVFAAVQVMLVAIWALTGPLEGDWYPWFVYPLLGWGVGLAAHYVAVRDSIRRA